ncbi:hypothetical protein ACQKHG_01275, partial [Escherichia coli]
MHQSGSVSLCRSAISVLVATALYSPIALASTVEYGETVDGVVLEKDIQLVYGTANNTKINPGGEQHIKEFGVSNNTEINGGYQYIEMNGAAEYSVLNDGGNDSNLLIVFYVQIMPDDFVMQLHR